jgi:DNA-binding NtrC family response regulator
MSDIVSTPRVTVLVVGGETFVRGFASDLLDDAGFEVFAAMRADHAVAVIEANPEVQVVMTDAELPGPVSGFELANVIRERWPSIGLIITSGRQLHAIGGMLDNLPKGVPFLAQPHSPATVAKLIRHMAAL